ncbi:hypothetical protein K456DRAFT_1722436 [Colletotrichum gloeosporioides 23]|nr:hypothetical protein K456DRAFT_1722436 [Colletotrichum gloeosporioides 23]
MLLSRVCVAILTSVACVGAVDTSAAQENPTIDLGELDSLDVFFSMLGTNSSQWVDISEYETPDDPAVIDTWRNTPPNTTRYNYCQDLTGFARIVCENMPHRYAVWVAGGAYIISYGPGALTEWLNGMAAAIRAGRNVRAAWIGDENGGVGGQPVPDSRRAIAGAGLPDDTNIRFAIPADLHGMQKRQVSEEGTIDVKITSEYIYNSATKELTYESFSGSFSFGASESLMARTPVENDRAKTTPSF